MNESLLEESMEIHKKSMKMAARVKLPGISLPEPFEVPQTGLKTRMSEDSVSRSVSFQVENPLDPRRRSTLSGKGGPSKSSSKNFIVGSHLDFSDTVSKILTCQDDDGEEVENKQDKEEQRHSDESIVSSAPQQPVHQTYTGPIEYSQWKLIKRLVKGDYIGHEWLDFNNGVYEPPKEDWSIVSEGCEMIMIKKEFLLKYLRRDW
ncbi:uncharacterized protein LOC131932759 [Physella acuta]|uniref:uncharacterized protein LOC131932759 n=1 Tax=Physella acuta TaxID=109671 RepID=UPI0027DAB8E4|nr:uncharacterized protein LOC131932759 [Physella acuta]